MGFWWDGHYGPENSDFVSVVMFLRHFGQTVETESGPKRILLNCSRSNRKEGIGDDYPGGEIVADIPMEMLFLHPKVY